MYFIENFRDLGEEGLIILTVVRNPGPRLCGHQQRSLLLPQPLTCRLGVEERAGLRWCLPVHGVWVLPSPPPHTSLKTTLMSQLSVCSVLDTQGCNSSCTIVQFCKLSLAKPHLFQMCI